MIVSISKHGAICVVRDLRSARRPVTEGRAGLLLVVADANRGTTNTSTSTSIDSSNITTTVVTRKDDLYGYFRVFCKLVEFLFRCPGE